MLRMVDMGTVGKVARCVKRGNNVSLRRYAQLPKNCPKFDDWWFGPLTVSLNRGVTFSSERASLDSNEYEFAFVLFGA